MVGIGASGARIAGMLHHEWDVLAVDPDPGALAALLGSVPPEGRAAIATHAGDGTSALVLEKAGARDAHLTVLSAGSDEVNLEAARVLAERFGVARRIALSRDPASDGAYRLAGVEFVSRSHSCAIAVSSLVREGHKVARDVGLGVGEIIEVEVLPASPVVGRPLKELHPKRWLIGAIYRGGALIIPHGETLLEAADRVLLIGDAEILPDIATLIRSGESEFPLQYGSHLVALCDPGLGGIAAEVAYLLSRTKADRLEVAACRGDSCRLGPLSEELARHGVAVAGSCDETDDAEGLLRLVAQKDVGLFVRPPEPIGLRARFGLGRTETARILDLLDSPLLMARGTFPYGRVLLALAELPFPNGAAQLAVDVARMLGAQLRLATVLQAEIVVGAGHGPALSARGQELAALAANYRVAVERVALEGNPVRALIEASGEHDLIVIPYPRGRRPSLIRPSIALNVLHGARCSVMAMPY